jgi:hypothetical protein
MGAGWPNSIFIATQLQLHLAQWNRFVDEDCPEAGGFRFDFP